MADRFEWKVETVYFKKELEDTLNHMTEKGWHIYQIFSNDNNWEIISRRIRIGHRSKEVTSKVLDCSEQDEGAPYTR